MAKLIYSMFTSLDGYTEDEHGRFGWGAPEDEELHSYVNELASSFGTYLYGRRMYETMVYWEAAHSSRSTTVRARLCEAVAGGGEDRLLQDPRRGARTRIEREFDSDAVRRLKAEAEHDITVDGPQLAAQAMRAGLVDVSNDCLPRGRRQRKTVLPGWSAAGPRASRGAK